MKKMKFTKTISIFMALVCVCMLIMPVSVQAAKVSISATKKTITVGKTTTLKISGTSKKVTWTSSNKKIATVSSKGKVKGIKAGTCTIKAKVGGKTYSCKVTVKKDSKDSSNKSIEQQLIDWAASLGYTNCGVLIQESDTTFVLYMLCIQGGDVCIGMTDFDGMIELYNRGYNVDMKTELITRASFNPSWRIDKVVYTISEP